VKKELQRPDGSLVRFGDNACVLVNKSGDPIGTRMNGKCSRGVWDYRCLHVFRYWYLNRCGGTRATEQEVVQDLVIGANPCLIFQVSTFVGERSLFL
jgi:hypothetical protein